MSIGIYSYHVSIIEDFSWDISEAIRMHIVSKQLLPSTVLSSQQSSLIERCIQFHTRQLNEREGGEEGGREGAGAVVMLGHVCKILEGLEEDKYGEDIAASQ